MTDSVKGRTLIMAAGGIVFREGPKPRIAVVRLRRDKAWVLPKGKLNPGERPLAAAKREVREETGYDVSVHEFLGAMSYSFNRKTKIVQFWHMRTIGEPAGKLMSDVKAVKWLSLKQAIETLTRAHERVFLANVGPAAVKSFKQAVRDRAALLDGEPMPKSPPTVPVEPPLPASARRTMRNPLAAAVGWTGRLLQGARRSG